MQTSREESKTKKSRAKVSKAATSKQNPDVQELPQAASNSGTAEQQPTPAVELLDLNKIVSSTYNPPQGFPAGDLAGTRRQHPPGRDSATDLRPTQRGRFRDCLWRTALLGRSDGGAEIHSGPC